MSAEETTVASLTIHRASDMTDDGRARIATWLRQHADDLMVSGGNYATRFRGRYIVPARSKAPISHSAEP